jgi:MFS family permease
MRRFLSDRNLIYTSSFIRSIGFGIIAVLVAIFLITLNFTKIQVGFVVSAGLIGGALGNLITTFLADRFGRKKVLIFYALINALSVVALCFATNFYTLLCIAFFGMLNARGKDRGVAVILETAILPSLEDPKNRTKAFAGYAIIQDVGLAVGSAIAGLPTLISSLWDVPQLVSLQSLFYFYGACMAVTALLYMKLSNKAEVPTKKIKTSCSKTGKKIVAKIAALFALDSLGSGFLTSALVSFYLYERFEIGLEALGLLFFCARLINSISYFAAVWVSKRIGLINAMVFSHAPSHLLLIAIAFTPSFPVVVVLFLLREFLVEMDVPTRQSYVMAVVQPEDRTFASGATMVVRMAGWALAPAFAGYIMHTYSSVAPLLIGAGLKLSYDALMYFSFKKIKPPEELPVVVSAKKTQLAKA